MASQGVPAGGGMVGGGMANMGGLPGGGPQGMNQITHMLLQQLRATSKPVGWQESFPPQERVTIIIQVYVLKYSLLFLLPFFLLLFF